MFITRTGADNEKSLRVQRSNLDFGFTAPDSVSVDTARRRQTGERGFILVELYPHHCSLILTTAALSSPLQLYPHHCSLILTTAA
ncbi:hypothetical protein RRG08_044994 [Elysia crispata]|uniref:Uncharacterized protein n=1 Tax=Elysia crispata TaxID=231223 RepID=A0AAE1CRY9_9GAST|nr:hypothetical protein RRG08_044994 [Elysia crispata]